MGSEFIHVPLEVKGFLAECPIRFWVGWGGSFVPMQSRFRRIVAGPKTHYRWWPIQAFCWLEWGSSTAGQSRVPQVPRRHAPL